MALAGTPKDAGNVSPMSQGALPRQIDIHAIRSHVFKYAGNPGEEGAAYVVSMNPTHPGEFPLVSLAGKEPSYNNMNEAVAIYQLVSNLTQPAVAVAKHGIFSGVSYAASQERAWELALQCDPEANFGGVEVFNTPVKVEVAERIREKGKKGDIRDVIIAPGYEEGAVDILKDARRGSGKDNLRVLQVNNYTPPEVEVRMRANILLAQTPMQFTPLRDDEIVYSGERKKGEKTIGTVDTLKPRPNDIILLKALGIVAAMVPSNAAVVGDGKVIDGEIEELYAYGIGTSTKRNRAVRMAIENANDLDMLKRFGYDTSPWPHGRAHGALLASDGFFPFSDSIELAADAGIRAIISGAGAYREGSVVDAANEHGIPLALCKRRLFRH